MNGACRAGSASCAAAQSVALAALLLLAGCSSTNVVVTQPPEPAHTQKPPAGEDTVPDEKAPSPDHEGADAAPDESGDTTIRGRLLQQAPPWAKPAVAEMVGHLDSLGLIAPDLADAASGSEADGFDVLAANGDRRIFAFSHATEGEAFVVALNRSEEAQSTRIPLPPALRGGRYEMTFTTAPNASFRVQQDASGLLLEIEGLTGMVVRRKVAQE